MDVTVYGPLRSATGGKTTTVEFEGGTTADALRAFVDAYPRAESHIYDDGEPRSSVRVTVDGKRAAMDDPCPADAELTVFPAVQGGRGAEEGESGR